jgi:hypothetical protein
MVQEIVVWIELVDMALHLTCLIVDRRVLRAPRIAIAIVGLTGLQEVVFVYRARANCSPIRNHATAWWFIWGVKQSKQSRLLPSYQHGEATGDEDSHGQE